MNFWRCYYHFIWTTKNRAPLIQPHIEPIIFDTIRQITEEVESKMLAINGTEDHIHVAVELHPKNAISYWMKRAKGASSHAVNSTFPDEHTQFQWQRGYGVLTFGKKNLPFIVAYIDSQKQRHLTNSLEPYMERIENN